MTRTAALNAVYDLAKKDERVIFLGSDLAPNTMADFRRDFPDRWLMEGICEQNVIGIAAGLALEGFIPYVNNIATFITRRCYEQIVVDLCMHNLPVRLLGNGGGLVYAPLGGTHMAIDDISIMRSIPNMSVVCCADNEEMKEFMPTTLEHKGPMYIRLGKDSDPILPYREKKYLHFTSYPQILVISTGFMSHLSIEAIKKLDVLCDFEHVAQIKPLNIKIRDIYKCVIVIEEGITSGGLGDAVRDITRLPVLKLGIPDAFPHHYGEQKDLLETYELTPEKMANHIKDFYESI